MHKNGIVAGKRRPAHFDALFPPLSRFFTIHPASGDARRRNGSTLVDLHSRPAIVGTLVTSIFSTAIYPTVAAAESVTELDRVVVTASRFPAALEQPVAMTVITAEEIAESTASTLGEVLSRLGGVHVRQNLTGTPDQPLDLRGFGVSGDQNTLILINGQRISENELVSARISAVPLVAIERIEILRGSGTVLYGGGATGGTINIVTRGSLGTPPGGSVFASYGSYNANELRAAVNGGSGYWGYALHANRSESNNYRRNNDAKVENLGAEVAFGHGNNRAALRINGNRQRVRLPGTRSESEYRNDPRGTSTPNDSGELDGWDATFNVQHGAGPVVIAADLGYREKSNAFFNAFAGGSYASDVDAHVTNFSPRVKWTTDLGGMENVLIAGADWSEWQYRNDAVFAGTGFSAPTRERATQRNRALYVQDNLQLLPGSRLTLGGRHERISLSAAESVTPIPRRERDYSLNAWEAGLRQELARNLTAYVRFGQSFRVANVDEIRCSFPPCQAMLEPQTSHDREIGIEYQTRDIAAQVALFDISLDHEIHFNRLSGFFGQNENLPQTRRRGMELKLGYAFSPSLEFDLRYAYTEAEFRGGEFSGVRIGGNDVPSVPRHRANGSLNWKILPTTRLVAAVTYTGRQHYDNDQANRFEDMPSYTVTDVKLTHTIGAVTLAAGINNLFDRKYYSYALVNNPLAPTSFNAYPEARRNGYASVAFCW